MRILARRFLASDLSALAACVGALLLALAIVDMLVDFDAVVEGGAAAFLAAAIPTRRGEILTIRRAGIHPARVIT